VRWTAMGLGTATAAALLLLVAPASAQTQDPLLSRSSPFVTRGAFFALSVPDLDASVRWYRESLGLQLVLRPPPREGVAMAALEGGGLLVELIHDPAALSLGAAAPSLDGEHRLHGVFKAGIVVEDWSRLLAELERRGVPIAIGPFPATVEQRANLIIRDNSGNYIQFFGDYLTPRP
jgi:catechol 2,3-dioxygenase-like lactoylglutathione lyase family enzyme